MSSSPSPSPALPETAFLGAFELNAGESAFFADVKEASLGYAPRTGDMVTGGKPLVASMDVLLENADAAHADAVKQRLKNTVRKCGACGKANGFTLDTCNGCGASLKDTPISHTNNVFTGFACGVERGPFPFTISLRHADDDFIVFDDLLSLTPAHINVIPTSQFIPDWRYLLRDPLRGLALVDHMHALCMDVLRKQFLASPEWRTSTLNADSAALDDDALAKFVLAGFNFPPSQFQLHLQFMMPPFLPFQYQQYLRGVHMTPERFFPLSYVRAVLALDIPYPVENDTPIQDIITHYKAQGVDYDVIHTAYVQRASTAQAALANWTPDRFQSLVIDHGPGTPHTVIDIDTKEPRADADATAIINNDKAIIQNYGRPYVDNKPSGTYYPQAKASPLHMKDSF